MGNKKYEFGKYKPISEGGYNIPRQGKPQKTKGLEKIFGNGMPLDTDDV